MGDIVLKKSNKFTHGNFHSHYRGSKYRGVTVNGNQWQTIINIDCKKTYLCTTYQAAKAGYLYDIAIIQCKGLKAKTNFDYTKEQVLSFLLERNVIKDKKM